MLNYLKCSMDLISSTDSQITPDCGSNAVGCHAASDKYRYRAPEFNSGLSLSLPTEITDIRYTFPAPIASISVSLTRT